MLAKTLLTIVKDVAAVAVPLAAFSSGLSSAGRLEGFSLWKNHGSLLRPLLAILVIVPAMAVLLLSLFDLPDASRLGLLAAIVAIGIGPPAFMKATNQKDAVVGFEIVLNVSLLLLSIVFLPLAMAIHKHVAHDQAYLDPWSVAKVVFLRALLPLALGIGVARMFPERIAPHVHRSRVVASVLMLVVVALGVLVSLKSIVALGWVAWLAAACLALGAIVAGDLIGRAEGEKRTVLVSFCTMRFPALALLVAGATSYGPRLVPVVLLYTLVSSLLLLGYRLLRARHSH